MEDEEDLISAAYNELPPEDGQDGIEMQTYGSPDKQHPNNDYAEEVELNQNDQYLIDEGPALVMGQGLIDDSHTNQFYNDESGMMVDSRVDGGHQ